MKMLLSPNTFDDYETLLRAKQLPRYEVRGSWLIFPDEYAEIMGVSERHQSFSEYDPAPFLFDYQEYFAEVAVAKKRFSLFWDCGLGKTAVQLEFARHCSEVLPPSQKVLIVTWMMIIPQFLEEVERFYGSGMKVEQVPSGGLADWLKGDGRIGITNWDTFKKPVKPGDLGAVVADETSILKNSYGTIGRNFLECTKQVEWKLGGTGTPAPNDCHEYANHAVMAGACKTSSEFYGRYFVNRGQTNNRWELREHAKGNFYRELSHWSVFLNNPATYGFTDNVGTLPPIHVHIDDVELTKQQEEMAYSNQGMLFGVSAGGIVDRARMSKLGKGLSKHGRIKTNKVDAIKRLAKGPSIIWCLYNDEQAMMEEAFPGAASIKGTTPVERRIELVEDFKSGAVDVLISKPKILGFGLNLQRCERMIFSGLQDSYESYYQAVKRANRIGSTKPLHVHIPVTEIERPMIETVLRKADRIHRETALQEQLFRENCPQWNGK